MVDRILPAGPPTPEPQKEPGSKKWFILVALALLVAFVFLVPVKENGAFKLTVWDWITGHQGTLRFGR